MRGKQSITVNYYCSKRNIPAYAGKTLGFLFQPDAFKEHPRVCGENASEFPEKLKNFGTSPRMRGKRFRYCVLNGTLRNIPAYAGKTTFPTGILTWGEEHPRVCGENWRWCSALILISGTSPRMRGKHFSCLTDRKTQRNIPAYAGKTPRSPGGYAAGPEHPRVCGEN